jgi:hypothetical protein
MDGADIFAAIAGTISSNQILSDEYCSAITPQDAAHSHRVRAPHGH